MLRIPLLAMLLVPSAALAAPPSRDDDQALRGIIESFDRAIADKRLSDMKALFYKDTIVWRGTLHPATKTAVGKMTGKPQPDVEDTGAHQFLEDPRMAKVTLRERFGPPTIDTDGQLASISFNYAFEANGKVQNWGREYWQLVKTTEGWRILSLLFSATIVQVASMPANHLADPVDATPKATN